MTTSSMLGDPASDPSIDRGAAAGEATDTTATPAVSAATQGNLTINLEFDANALAAPQSFRNAIQAAANILDAAIYEPITVNLIVEYGESEGSSGGAEAGPDNGLFEPYSTIRADLIANAAPGDTNFNALPNASSIQGQSQVAVWNAQLKALGLLAANANTDDGTADFGTGIPANLLVGVALHELTHAMGRVGYGPQPDIFDLFRFTSPGTRLFEGGSTAPAAYFSVDGGNTKLADFGQTKDSSDFLNPPASTLTPNDAFNEFYSGSTLQTLTSADLTMLDVLGFDVTPSSDTTPPRAVNDSSLTLASGTTAAITKGLLTFSDNVSTHAQETFTVLGAPADGTLLKNGVATSSFTQADIDNGLISYRETVANATSDSFTFVVTDAAGNATPTESFGFVITGSDTTPPRAVNDSSLTLASGTTAAITKGLLTFSDNVSTHAQETFTVLGAPADGTLLKNGVATSSFTQADIDNGLISYRETVANATSDSFTFVVTDAAGNATPTESFGFVITGSDTTPPRAVNDSSLTLASGTTAAITKGLLTFSDNVSTHAQETFTVLGAPADGTLLKNGVATSSFTQADIDNGLISYRETVANATSDAFTFAVTDAAGNTTPTESFGFVITGSDTTPPRAVNDSSQSLAPGATTAILKGQLLFSDAVSPDSQEIFTVLGAPADGTLLKNGVATSSFTQADIDNGLIDYRETVANATSDAFTFAVTDAAGNTTPTESFGFVISPADTAPRAVNDSSQSLAPGATAAITKGLLTFSDNVSTHAQETFIVLVAPTDGTLLKNGVATSSFTQADIDNGLIDYRETALNATSDSFTFAVTDAAGNTTPTESFGFVVSLNPASPARSANLTASLAADHAVTVPSSGSSLLGFGVHG